jgi:hypothetical protein
MLPLLLPQCMLLKILGYSFLNTSGQMPMGQPDFSVQKGFIVMLSYALSPVHPSCSK